MTALSPLASRLLALALLAVVALIVHAGAVAPLRERFRTYEASIEELGRQLDGYARLAAHRPALERRRAAFAERLETEGGLLRAATDALATAGLLALVKDGVERNGAAVGSVLPLEPSEDGTLRRIAVRVEFSADIVALRAILYALEGGHPVLVIDQAEVSAGPVHDRHEPVPLGVALEVHGYRREGVQ